MKQFKYPVSFKCESPEQMERLAKELEKLGHNSFNLVVGKYNYCPYLVTQYAGMNGCFSNSYDSFSETNHLCQSEEEFTALAAMVDDDKFYEGEWVYINHYGEFYPTHTNLDYSRGTYGETIKNVFAEIVEDVSDKLLNGRKVWALKVGNKIYYSSNEKNYLRKATDTEIIIHFRKSEPKPNNKEPFTVEGSVPLKKALAEELMECDIPAFNKSTIDYEFLTVGKYGRYVQGAWGKKERHYKLPEQYNEALQAFIDFYKEEKPREVEVTLSNGRSVVVKHQFVVYKDDMITINEVKKLHNVLISKAHLSVYNGFPDYKVTIKAHIAPGCCVGMEVTSQDTQLILDTHAKIFE